MTHYCARSRSVPQGNALSSNVFERLLPRVAFAAGLVSRLPPDSWAEPGYNPLRGRSRGRIVRMRI